MFQNENIWTCSMVTYPQRRIANYDLYINFFPSSFIGRANIHRFYGSESIYIYRYIHTMWWNMHIVHVMYCVLYMAQSVARPTSTSQGRVREYKQHQQQCNKLRHFYQIFAFMLAVIFLLLLIFMLRTWMPRQMLSCCWMADWLGVCVCLYALFLFKIHFCFLSFNEFIRKMVIEQSSSNVRAKCNSARNGFTFFSTRSFGDARIIHQTVELLNDYFPFWCVYKNCIDVRASFSI